MLHLAFDMKDLGKCQQLLGISINHELDRTLMISQQGYIKAALQEFGLGQCKPVSILMESGWKLLPALTNNLHCSWNEYQHLIGKLMWVMLTTRPDICFSVGQLSQFNANPRQQHWIAAKRVLRYLKGTIQAKLHYSKGGNGLWGCSDSDFTEDPSQKSTSGCLFVLADGAITWISKKQSLVASSTTEVEYIAYSEAAKEAAWLQQLSYNT